MILYQLSFLLLLIYVLNFSIYFLFWMKISIYFNWIIDSHVAESINRRKKHKPLLSWKMFVTAKHQQNQQQHRKRNERGAHLLKFVLGVLFLCTNSATSKHFLHRWLNVAFIYYWLAAATAGGVKWWIKKIKHIDKAHLPINTQYINQWVLHR